MGERKAKPPRFFIQQVTEHSWQLQERQWYPGLREWGYGHPFPVAQHCTSRAEAEAWMRRIVAGDYTLEPEAFEPLIKGPAIYFDDVGLPTLPEDER